MKFILILWLTYYNGDPSRDGSMMTAEFNSQATCEVALKAVKDATYRDTERGAPIHYIGGVCVKK